MKTRDFASTSPFRTTLKKKTKKIKKPLAKKQKTVILSFSPT